MKHCIVILCCCVLICAEVSAQGSDPIRVGPYCALKADINSASIPNGWKTAPVFLASPDVGLNVLVPVLSASGIYASLDAGFNSSATLSKPYTNANDSNTMVMGIRYFSFCPAIALPNAFLGLRIGLPLGASVVSVDGSVNQRSIRTGTSANESSVDLASQCATVFELRLGGMLPLIEDSHGSLHAYATVGYQLNSGFKSFSTVAPLLYSASSAASTYDPRFINLSLGLRYLFELSH